MGGTVLYDLHDDRIIDDAANFIYNTVHKALPEKKERAESVTRAPKAPDESDLLRVSVCYFFYFSSG